MPTVRARVKARPGFTAAERQPSRSPAFQGWKSRFIAAGSESLPTLMLTSTTLIIAFVVAAGYASHMTATLNSAGQIVLPPEAAAAAHLQFHQWQGDGLVERASWHDESPYNGTDAPFALATHVNSNGETTEFRLEPAAETDSIFLITQRDKLFAKITFQWSKPLGSLTGTGLYSYGLESAYLFEKLAGLPRKLYPGDVGRTRVKALENTVKIHVEGEPAAIELLSPRQ